MLRHRESVVTRWLNASAPVESAFVLLIVSVFPFSVTKRSRPLYSSISVSASPARRGFDAPACASVVSSLSLAPDQIPVPNSASESLNLPSSQFIVFETTTIRSVDKRSLNSNDYKTDSPRVTIEGPLGQSSFGPIDAKQRGAGSRLALSSLPTAGRRPVERCNNRLQSSIESIVVVHNGSLVDPRCRWPCWDPDACP